MRWEIAGSLGEQWPALALPPGGRLPDPMVFTMLQRSYGDLSSGAVA
jgi:hypothetical protein